MNRATMRNQLRRSPADRFSLVMANTLQALNGGALRSNFWRIFLRFAKYAALMLFSVFLGLATVFLPWFFMVGLVLVVGYTLLLIFAPWVGVAVYLLVLLLMPDFKLADLCTLYSIAVLAFARIRLISEIRGIPGRNLLIGFASVVVLALIYGVVVERNEIPYVYRDGRVFVYWLWLPVFFLMRKGDELWNVKLERAVVFLAASIAVIALVQYATGVQIVAAGRVGALETVGTLDTDVTRVQMPGFVFVLIALCWCLVMYAQRKLSLLVGIAFGLLLLAAVYVNFGRALWLWCAVACVSVVLYVRVAQALRLVMVIGLFASSLLTLALLFNPIVIEKAVERLESIALEGGSRTSFGWRRVENEYATKALVGNPVFGVGVGGQYRPWLSELRHFEDHTRYIHNGYLFLAAKTGVVALVIVLVLIGRSWAVAWRNRKESGASPLSIASLAAVPAVMGLNITQPELMNPFGVLFLSICLVAMFASQTEQPKNERGARR